MSINSNSEKKVQGIFVAKKLDWQNVTDGSLVTYQAGFSA